MRPDGHDGELYGWSDDDRADDWLGEQGELDWVGDPRRGEPPERPRSDVHERPIRDPAPAPARHGRGSAPTAETFARRRTFAVLTVAGIVVVAVIAIVVATSGGGSSTSTPTTAPSVAPPPAPQPAPSPAPQPTIVPTTTTTATRPAATTPTETQPVSPSTGPEVTLPPNGQLAEGDSGAEVVALQKALAELGLDVGQPDGSFGPTTKTAVAAFQNSHGLTPDGIVGATTAKALNDALAARG